MSTGLFDIDQLWICWFLVWAYDLLDRGFFAVLWLKKTTLGSVKKERMDKIERLKHDKQKGCCTAEWGP